MSGTKHPLRFKRDLPGGKPTAALAGHCLTRLMAFAASVSFCPLDFLDSHHPPDLCKGLEGGSVRPWLWV